MERLSRFAPWFVALAAAAGCASTNVIARERYEGEKLARPDLIIVYDFAATPSDIPRWAAGASRYVAGGEQQTAEEIATGRELGAHVAAQLVEEIQGMGLPAVRAAGQPAARIGDIVIVGYFESVDEGSVAKRVVLGFGSGAVELKTLVEGYLMTDRGPRKLGSGEVDSGGGKGPGVAVPLAVTVATANPIGLIVGGAVKVGGEVSGKSTIEGSAERTAHAIAEELRGAFERQGWI
jgi:hypothetical protein